MRKQSKSSADSEACKHKACNFESFFSKTREYANLIMSMLSNGPVAFERPIRYLMTINALRDSRGY